MIKKEKNKILHFLKINFSAKKDAQDFSRSFSRIVEKSFVKI